MHAASKDNGNNIYTTADVVIIEYTKNSVGTKEMLKILQV